MSVINEECLLCDIFTKMFGIYAIALILVSTIGNFYSSIICFRLGQKKKAIFKILAYIFVLNALTLYTWTFDIFLAIVLYPAGQIISNIDNVNIIESLSIPTCKIFTFNQYFTLETISWLLVFLLIHQNIQLYFPKLRYNVRLVCLIVIGFFFLFNSHILIFAGKIENQNTSTSVMNITHYVEKKSVNCFFGETYGFYTLWPLWDKVHLLTYSFIPFVLMIICNIVTIYRINNSNSESSNHNQNHNKKYKQKRKLAVTLLVISFSFMACSLPQIILYGYFFDVLSSNRRTFLILPGSDLLNFTFVGLNFLIFLVTNKIFRTEFFMCWHEFKKWLRFNFFKCLFLLALLSETKYSFECDRYFRPDVSKCHTNDKELQMNSFYLINFY